MIPKLPGPGQIVDVAAMENIETAIGHHHGFAPSPCSLHRQQQLIPGQDIAHVGTLGTIASDQGRCKFFSTNGRRAQFGYHQARSGIGQSHAIEQTLPRRQGRSQYRNNRIPGTGDIKHLPGLGRQGMRTTVPLQQGHAALTPGDKQGLQIQFRTQPVPPLQQLGLGFAVTHHRLEFRQVGR